MALRSTSGRKQPLKMINKSSYSNDLTPLDFSFRSLTCVSEIIGEVDEEESTRDPPHKLELLHDRMKDIPSSTTSTTTTSRRIGTSTTTTADPNHINIKTNYGGYSAPGYITRSKPVNCISDSSGKRRRKSRSKCLRLNNNSLDTIVGLKQILYSLFLRPLQLSWLDLSFNVLTVVPDEITELHCLQIVYLHGNSLENLTEVEKFRPMTNLKKLTLHGNPIEKIKNYRFTVLTTVPSLNEFDFSSVVKSDRENAELWLKNNISSSKRRRNKYHLQSS